jgi:RNA-binding protein
MSLTSSQKSFLRGKAHHLKPVVIVGQHGLSENVLSEMDQALLAHELIKFKMSAAEREEKKRMIEKICTHTSSELIQTIGNMAILYRRHPKKPRLVLPS